MPARLNHFVSGVIQIFTLYIILTLTKQLLEIQCQAFIVAPCVMESIYCSLTNKFTFY